MNNDSQEKVEKVATCDCLSSCVHLRGVFHGSPNDKASWIIEWTAYAVHPMWWCSPPWWCLTNIYLTNMSVYRWLGHLLAMNIYQWLMVSQQFSIGCPDCPIIHVRIWYHIDYRVASQGRNLPMCGWSYLKFYHFKGRAISVERTSAWQVLATTTMIATHHE